MAALAGQGNVDAAALYEALNHSINPDPQVRKRSEAYLEGAFAAPHYIVELLKVVCANVPDHIKLAGAVRLKNVVRRHWNANTRFFAFHEPQEVGSKNAKFEFAEADKAQLRAQLIEAIAQSQSKPIRSVLCETVASVAISDFPSKWPDMADKIVAGLNGGDVQQIHSMLAALHRILKRYMFTREEALVKARDAIMERCFPVIEGMFGKLLSAGLSNQAAIIMKLALKSFWDCAQLELPAFLANPQRMAPWMETLKAILEIDTSNSPDRPSDVDDLDSWVWWKLKKWVLQIWYRIAHRFGNPNYAEPKFKQFSLWWQDNLSVPLQATTLNLLARRVNGLFVSRKCTMLAFKFIGCGIELGKTWVELKPALDDLLFKVIVPITFYSDADAELWETDPHEYVRKTYDPMEDFTDPRMAAAELVCDLAKARRKQVMPKLMSFFVSFLNTYAAAPAEQKGNANCALCRQKDGILGLLGNLHEILQEREDTAGQLESLIAHHVLPEFTSATGFLRARACWMLQFFEGIEWSNPQNRVQCAQKVYERLTQDTTLPVRIAAAAAMRMIISESDDEQLAVFTPGLPAMLKCYFDLIREIGVDEVIDALSTIITRFADDVEPYAVEIMKQLVEAFLRFAGQNINNDDDEAAMAAINCLECAVAMLDAIPNPEDKAMLFRQLEPQVLPAVLAILEPSGRGIEYLEQALSILAYITYYGPPQFTPELWATYPMMFNAFIRWAYDYIDGVSVPLLNFVERDTERFLSGGAAVIVPPSKEPVQLAYADMCILVARKIIEDADAGRRDTIIAARILEGLLQNALGMVDQYLPQVLHIALTRLKTAEQVDLKVALLEVVETAIYYDPATTLRLLSEANLLQIILTMLMQHLQHHASVRQKELCSLAFLGIFRLPSQQLPEILQRGLPQIYEKLIEMTTNMLAQREMEENQGDSSDEDDSDDSDDSDDDDDVSDDDDEIDFGDGDVVNEEDLEYMSQLDNMRAQFHAAAAIDGLDDVEDEDDFSSKFDKIDTIQIFKEVVLANPACAQMNSTLSPSAAQALRNIMAKQLQTPSASPS